MWEDLLSVGVGSTGFEDISKSKRGPIPSVILVEASAAAMTALVVFMYVGSFKGMVALHN